MLTPVQLGREKDDGKMDKDKMHESYERYLQTQCSYWGPGNDQFLAGEVVFQWANRESIRSTLCHQQAEMAKIDGVLSGLLYEMKKKLSHLGRNGRWSLWLRQQDIPRATADRLVLDHAEYFDLKDELPHRAEGEPLEGRVCQAAHRTSDRLENMLSTARSRMSFVKVLANLFGLGVEYGEADSVRVTMPPPLDAANVNHRVPNVIEVHDDGSIRPVDYELKDEDVL